MSELTRAQLQAALDELHVEHSPDGHPVVLSTETAATLEAAAEKLLATPGAIADDPAAPAPTETR